MPADVARNVLDHARNFHQQIGEYYHMMANIAQRPRVRMLLDYMSVHEQRLAMALADYENAAPAKVLQTWLRSGENCAPLQEAREQFQKRPLDPMADVDEIIDLGMRFTECLLTAYRDLAINAEPEVIRSVFGDLVRMEEQAQQQFARDAGRLGDL